MFLTVLQQLFLFALETLPRIRLDLWLECETRLAQNRSRKCLLAP